MKKYNIEKLREKLERCKNISFNNITLDDVDDASTVKIRKKKNEYDIILNFVKKTKNPYIFKINGKLVQIGFTNNGKTAEVCLTNVLKILYR